MANDPFVARLRKLDVCDVSDAVDALELPPAVTDVAGVPEITGGRFVVLALRTVIVKRGSAPAL